jgi:hypothetical protein
MRRRRREHSLLLKASKILVSLGASVNLTLSHRRRALRSFPLRRRGTAGSAAPAARNVDATSPVANGMPVIETIIAVTASNQPMASVIVPLPAVEAWGRAP